MRMIEELADRGRRRDRASWHHQLARARDRLDSALRPHATYFGALTDAAGFDVLRRAARAAVPGRRAGGAVEVPPERAARKPTTSALFGAFVEPDLVDPRSSLDYPREISPLAKEKRGRSGRRRALRALRRRDGGRQRLLRAERPDGPGGSVARAEGAAPARRRGGAGPRSRLPPRPHVRHAAHRRARGWGSTGWR